MPLRGEFAATITSSSNLPSAPTKQSLVASFTNSPERSLTRGWRSSPPRSIRSVTAWCWTVFTLPTPTPRDLRTNAQICRISQRLVDTLKSGKTPQPAFRAKWRRTDSDASRLVPPPTRVIYDNVTSELATILQIFAPNRSGLLFTIARTLYKLDLSVTAAKIGTHLDQVVDVFYVTDMEGNKIQSESRLEQMRERLLEAIERVESEDPTT